MQDLFAHTISRVDFIDGMVRIEFVILTPTAEDTAGAEAKYALHLPLNGFMRGALTLENFIREMVRRGNLPPAPQAGTAPAEAAAPLAPPTASPNFG